jgi:hypothetical protein
MVGVEGAGSGTAREEREEDQEAPARSIAAVAQIALS